jgi:hypothetical protein
VVDLQLHAEEPLALSVEYRVGLIAIVADYTVIIVAAVIAGITIWIFIAIEIMGIIAVNNAAAVLTMGIKAVEATFAKRIIGLIDALSRPYALSAAVAGDRMLLKALRTE